MRPIGIVGLSHLGIVWSVGYGALGFDVVAYDENKVTVSQLKQGVLPIPEPSLPEQFTKARTRVRFTTDPVDLLQCDILFFAKDVDLDEEGRSDHAAMESLLRAMIPNLAAHVDLFFMSQIPVGYTRRLERRIQQERPELPFNLIYRVETLTIGQAVKDFLEPDRMIFGFSKRWATLSEKAQKIAVEPFRCPAVQMIYESAELTKSAINIYLGNSVTFVNTMANLCEKVGADIREVVAAMKLDKRFSPLCYWRPGLGFAGGHIEREIMTLTKLSEENGLKPKLLNTILETSRDRYQWLVSVLDRHVFAAVHKPCIALWGLAYKKGTDSLHNAHCLKIFRDYETKARIRAYDPLAKLPPGIRGVEVFSDKWEALNGADALLILTEWEEFAVADPGPFLERMKSPVIIDGVQILKRGVEEHPQIRYVGMGIPVKYAKST